MEVGLTNPSGLPADGLSHIREAAESLTPFVAPQGGIESSKSPYIVLADAGDSEVSTCPLVCGRPKLSLV